MLKLTNNYYFIFMKDNYIVLELIKTNSKKLTSEIINSMILDEE